MGQLAWAGSDKDADYLANGAIVLILAFVKVPINSSVKICADLDANERRKKSLVGRYRKLKLRMGRGEEEKLNE